jgi:CHAT domain-containing protein
VAIARWRELEQRRTVERLRDSALLSLEIGEPRRAVAELAEAGARAPNDAAILSDLAAAYLQRAGALADPYDYVLAFAAAHRALERDPALLPARFNQAMTFEHLGLLRQAGREWRLYLHEERDPLWSREAALHVMALARAASSPGWKNWRDALEQAALSGDSKTVGTVLQRSPQRFREYLEQDLLVAWAESASSDRNDRASDRLLTISRAIAAGLAASDGDRLGADTILQIDRLGRGSPGPKRSLIHGLQAYGVGFALAKKGDFTRALPALKTAQTTLARSGSPFARWAMFWTAICHYQRSDYRAARVLLATLGGEATRARYRAVHGRALWLLGLIDIIEGNPTASLSGFESALDDFSKLRERGYAARLNSLIASDFDYLGQPREAWRRLLPSLVEPATADWPLVRSANWEIASWLAREQGDYEIALLFEDEALREAQEADSAYGIVEALHSHSAVLVALGRDKQAAADLAFAERHLSKVADPITRESLRADIMLIEGELAISNSPIEAIASLNTAIQIFRATSYHYQLGQALYERALAERKVGRSDDAERDLRVAIAESELQRDRIQLAEERISYFDRKRVVLDAMLSLQLEQHHPDAALQFSEQAKGRVMLDWMAAQPIGVSKLPRPLDRALTSSVDIASIRRNLPHGTAVIEYAVMPRSVVIWVVRQEDVWNEEVAVEGRIISSWVENLNQALLKGRLDEFQKQSARLYETLISPAARHFSTGERLVIVPDGPLHALSFALLRDARSGRYLVEDHICSVAPSARIYTMCLRHDASNVYRPGVRGLWITGPEFDRQIYPDLPRLIGTETEAAMAQGFPGSRVLNGRAATRRAFLQSVGDFEIVHFGGHAVVNAEVPLLSQLLFASEPTDSTRGVLYSGDILGLRFGRLRLAVLASCGTARGRVSLTEGVENLARPFLAAGVPAVVAALWNIDDRLTSEFFGRFYSHLRLNFDAAAALRAAEVESLGLGSTAAADPRVWAAFEVIGAMSSGRMATSEVLRAGGRKRGLASH